MKLILNAALAWALLIVLWTLLVVCSRYAHYFAGFVSP